MFLVGCVLMVCFIGVSNVVAIRRQRETCVCNHCGRATARHHWRSRISFPSARSADDEFLVCCDHCRHTFDVREPPVGDGWPKMTVRHGPQVVGMACAVCGRKIVLDSEATPCATCDRPVHLDCLPHSHEDPAGPYRS